MSLKLGTKNSGAAFHFAREQFNSSERAEMRERLRRKAVRAKFDAAEWVELGDIGGGLVKRFEGGAAIMIRRQGSRWCATYSAPGYDHVCPLDGLFPTMEAARDDADAMLDFIVAFAAEAMGAKR